MIYLPYIDRPCWNSRWAGRDMCISIADINMKIMTNDTHNSWWRLKLTYLRWRVVSYHSLTSRPGTRTMQGAGHWLTDRLVSWFI